MKDGPLPMEFGFAGAPRQPVADAINDWLTEPGPGAVSSPRAS